MSPTNDHNNPLKVVVTTRGTAHTDTYHACWVYLIRGEVSVWHFNKVRADAVLVAVFDADLCDVRIRTRKDQT